MWCQIRYWQQTWKLEDEILTKHHYPDTRTRFTQWVHFWEPRLSLSLCPPAQFSQYCFTMWHKIFARWICWLVSARLWFVSRYRQPPPVPPWSPHPPMSQAGHGPGPGHGHENPHQECQAFWSPIVILGLTPLSRTKFDICFRSLFSEQ